MTPFHIRDRLDLLSNLKNQACGEFTVLLLLSPSFFAGWWTVLFECPVRHHVLLVILS